MSPSLPPKRRITVCTDTPARRATSSKETWSVGSSQNTWAAASRIRSPVAAAAAALAAIRYGRLSDFMLIILTLILRPVNMAESPRPHRPAAAAQPCRVRAATRHVRLTGEYTGG